MERDEAAKRPATAEAYEAVKKMIVSFELPPGQLLLMQRLALSLGASRTPVREALVRLKEEGLVEDAPGRKFRVAPLDAKTVDDVYEARRLLEGRAVKVLARRAGEVDYGAMEETIRRAAGCLKKGDRDGFFEADRRFHELLVELHGNAVFIDCFRRIKDGLQRIRRLTAANPERMRKTVDEHREIVELLRAGDGKGARAVLFRHFEQSRSDMRERLSRGLPGLFIG